MQLSTITYDGKRGWLGEFPSLDSPKTLVLAFVAPELVHEPKLVGALAKAYPQSVVLGCSSSGEIQGTKLSDNSASVAVAAFGKGELAAAQAAVTSAADSFAAGKSIAEQLTRPDLRAVFLLSDGLHVNGSELVRGLNSVVAPSVIVTGGLAGDGSAFKTTSVLGPDREFTSQKIVAVGFYGDGFKVGHGTHGGWDIFGPERTITRSEGNVLFEIDGTPALELYKTYLGDRASGLPATGLLFPMGIREGSDEERRLVRTILAIDEKQQSMTFAGDMPQGWRAQLMRANFDRVVEGSCDAATRSHDRGKHQGPVLAIAVSCVGRRLVLGERTEEELESCLDALPKGSVQVGFYSYGELAPLHSGPCVLHNQTMSVTTISDSDS